ncbi:MAG TPA: sigma-70 family RNA polymerase sigma factor [Tepidisphaeraceae bacterium]|nr:sigma-70 family RNA polymerase sigma factor [Tepidisphaeraceae bacterium]
MPTERTSDAPAASKSADEAGGPADGALVARVLSGERSAFDILVRRYQRQAVAVSFRLLGSNHDAQEVTQDAFLKAFTSLPTLQTPEAFGGWLMRIVSNLSLNFRRGRKTRWQLPLDEVLGPIESGSAAVSGLGESTGRGDDPVRRLEGQELGQKLKEALAKLPEKQRLALIMFTIEQMPQKQVAEALQCSVEAVKWHVFQGRKKLKDLLGDVM